MTTAIPKSALLLGVAGLLPFVWGAGTILSHNLYDLTRWTLGQRFLGLSLIVPYGVVILSFMSGVLWGFAAKGEKLWPYALSVLPALWAFFMVTDQSPAALIALLLGFLALFALDILYTRQGLAPPWWPKLRAGLTAGVSLCILVALNA